MATPGTSLRIPTALAALIDAEAERSQRSRSQVILDTLADRFIGEDTAPAPREKRAKRAPAPLPAVVPASALKERDLAPKLAEAKTSGDGRGSGLVSGLDLPLGNTRRPMAKGAGKAKG